MEGAKLTRCRTRVGKNTWTQRGGRSENHEAKHTFTPTGRLTGLDGPFADDGQNYGYDATGRLTSHDLGRGASAGTQSLSYAYDALERLASITSGGEGAVGSFTYNYVGNTGMLARLDLPNGTQTVQSYDSLQRLTQTVNQKDTGALLNTFAYSYDTRDVRTGVEQQYGNDPLRQVSYGYDATDQLKTEASSGGLAGTNYSNAFDYDGMGNRTRLENVSGGNTRVTGTTPNELNQISALSQSVNGAPAQTSGFSYDDSGNTTQITGFDGGKTLFSYDDADRLVRIETRDATDVSLSKSEFVYDYASRKAVSREFTYTAGAWVKTDEKRRVFDGLDVVQERNSDNEVTAQLVRDGNIGGILSRSTLVGASFFGYDGGGNVTLLTDENGDDVGRYRYDAFGNTLESSGSRAAENPYRFSTKELHGASGLYDFGFRFYSPGLGRWINRDPIEEDGGVNLYQFNYNSPTNYVDPDGRLPIIVVIVVAYRIYDAYGTAMDVKETWETWNDPCADSGRKLLSTATTLLGLIPGGKQAKKGKNLLGAISNAKQARDARGAIKQGDKLRRNKGAFGDLVRDGKNKVHGKFDELSTAEELKNAHPDDLRYYMDELRGSIAERTRLNKELGHDLGHGIRAEQEKKRLRELEALLGDR